MRIALALTAIVLGGLQVAPASADTAPHRVIAADQKVAVIAAAGDIACSPASSSFRGGRGVGKECRQLATALAAERLDPDAVLALGDNQYETAELADFRASFQPSWGRFLDSDPKQNRLWPVPGNHELDYVVDSGYWPSFNGGTTADPNPTGIAGVTGQGWYSMQIGRWQVLALNSECGYDSSYLGVRGCKPGSAQYEWLRQQLSESPTCTLAMFHRPRFSIGEHEGEAAVQPLWRLLANAKAEVVLTGHNHSYERYRPLNAAAAPARHGVRQFVVGTGGKNLYPWAWAGRGETLQPTAKSHSTAGVLKMRLAPTSYRWRFVRGDFSGNGRFSDAGKGRCH